MPLLLDPTAIRITPEPLRPMTLARAVACSFAVFGLAALAPSTASARADRIWQASGGKPIVADAVTLDTFDEVKYKRAGADATLPAARVRDIDYGDAPDSWQLGLDKRADGEFENAVGLLRAAMAEKDVRAWIKVQGPFEVAETYRQWGAKDKAKLADAVKSYGEALDADPKARIRPRILFGRARAQVASGDIAKALADFDQLIAESQKSFGAEWELKALFEKASALDESGKPEEAKREYSKLETTGKSMAARADLSEKEQGLGKQMAGLARLAQGRVLIRDGKPADAERFFSSIIDDANEDDSVRASALTGYGEALAAQKKLKEAQVALARVRIQFFLADEAVAEATYHLGLLAEQLAAAEPKGAKLAQDYFKEVVQRYGSSKWAQKAQAKIN